MERWKGLEHGAALGVVVVHTVHWFLEIKIIIIIIIIKIKIIKMVLYDYLGVTWYGMQTQIMRFFASSLESIYFTYFSFLYLINDDNSNHHAFSTESAVSANSPLSRHFSCANTREKY